MVLERENAEITGALAKLSVKTLIWNKQAGESLSDVLQELQATSNQETASMAMRCN